MTRTTERNPMLNRWTLAAGAGLLTLGLAACAKTGSSINSTPASSSSTTANPGTEPTTTPPSTTTTQAEATVGSTVDLSQESVTLQQVIDPAQSSNQYLNPDPGKRFVAVQIEIQNTGSQGLTGDANNNLAVKGTDNQGYSPDFDPVAECTNFNSGTYTIPQGQSESGCVTYQIPEGVNLSTVQFTPESGFSSETAQWKVG